MVVNDGTSVGVWTIGVRIMFDSLCVQCFVEVLLNHSGWDDVVFYQCFMCCFVCSLFHLDWCGHGPHHGGEVAFHVFADGLQ